ncbi:MAG: hypothetical protein CMH81_06990 [Nitrospiraceae bacterium]|nr:hypothetical protein [Nitrospiraceae bacterium]
MGRSGLVDRRVTGQNTHSGTGLHQGGRSKNYSDSMHDVCLERRVYPYARRLCWMIASVLILDVDGKLISIRD